MQPARPRCRWVAYYKEELGKKLNRISFIKHSTRNEEGSFLHKFYLYVLKTAV